jgi:peptidoglycan/xylan/chitin deacetylase (PgdA/CDA1 family)
MGSKSASCEKCVSAENMKGIFTISLDFELHWGGFEKWPLHKYKEYFLNTRKTIPRMLASFKQYDVHVTWATVGLLFFEDREQLVQGSPRRKPQYEIPELSAYHYIETQGIGRDEADDPFHFAPSLVSQIISTPGQELATHTFAHYYCNEAGQSVDDFRDDLDAAQRAANKYGQKLRSLVFPRNQFNEAYLRVCHESGIKVVRSNPLDWFWNIDSTQSESYWKRLNRGADAYLPVGRRNTYRLEALSRMDGIPLSLPASRLLRPYRPKEGFLNTLKIERIKSEMTRAARNGEVYHLWWHPHNFGSYPDQSLAGLSIILDHFDYCRGKYGMVSLNMGEISDSLV